MRTALRLVFFAAEFPSPPTHGGRADTWQRLRAFAAAGVTITLICWTSERRGGAPSAGELAVVRDLVGDVFVLPIELGPVDLAWRLVNLWRMPSHASARLPFGGRLKGLEERLSIFDPHAIWLDGLWGGAFAQHAARRLRVPYFFRSHNVEHRYMARQASLATSLPYKVRLRIAGIGLERFEEKVLRGAADVLLPLLSSAKQSLAKALRTNKALQKPTASPWALMKLRRRD